MENGPQDPPYKERRTVPRDSENQQRFQRYMDMQEDMLSELELKRIDRETFKRRNAASMMMLENLAFTSHKTLLPNELFFKNTLESEIGIMGRIPDYMGYVAYLDVDDLKGANSAYGHAGGDELLKTVALALIESQTEISEKYKTAGKLVRIFPAHASGDEFEVLISGLSKEQTAELGQLILDKILAGKNASENLRNLPQGRAASIGFRSINGESDTDTSINEADLAMFEAKQRGKNQIVFFEDLDPETIQRIKLEKNNPTKKITNP